MWVIIEKVSRKPVRFVKAADAVGETYEYLVAHDDHIYDSKVLVCDTIQSANQTLIDGLVDNKYSNSPPPIFEFGTETHEVVSIVTL